MKTIASTAVSAFLNGLLAWGATHLTDTKPSTGAQWAAFGTAAVLAGIIAVLHAYQPPPGSAS